MSRIIVTIDHPADPAALALFHKELVEALRGTVTLPEIEIHAQGSLRAIRGKEQGES